MSVYTQEDLDNLRAAQLRQESSVSIQGRTVTFRSPDEIARQIEIVKRELAGTQGRTRLLAEFSKGVNS